MKASAAAAVVLFCAFLAVTHAANCHHSSYNLACDKVKTAKTALWANCASKAKGGVTAVGDFTKQGTCCVIIQKTVDKPAWEAYSTCEKSAENDKYYGTLKAASPAGGPCDQYKKDETCT